MFPLVLIGNFVGGSVASDALSIATNEFLVSVGLASNTGADIAAIQSTLVTQGEALTALQAGMSHQAAMLTSIQSSISAVGMLSTVGCALSAVNVYQLVQLQKSINRLEHKIQDGFVDLKVYFSAQLQDLLSEQQRQRLIQAYNHYLKAQEQVQTALLMQDDLSKKLAINHAIAAFTQSLAIYDNKEEYMAVNLPARLRRLECCWALEAAIAEAHAFQEEYTASLECYQRLDNRISSEIEQLKEAMTPADYRLILGDAEWLYQNDMPLLQAKTQVLENYSKTQELVPIYIPANNPEENPDKFTYTYLQSARLYLDCLSDREKITDVSSKLSESSFDFSGKPLQDLNLIEKCNIYAEQFPYILSQENESSYILKDEVNSDFFAFLEAKFSDKKNPDFRFPYTDDELQKCHATFPCKHSFYEGIHYFNHAVSSYIEQGFTYLRQRKLNAEAKKQLLQIAEQVGISDEFSNGLNRLVIEYYANSLDENKKQLKRKLLALYAENASTNLPQDLEENVTKLENSVPLKIEEVTTCKTEIEELVTNLKESLILTTPENDFNTENEILVWKIQDELHTNKKTALAFLEKLIDCVNRHKEMTKLLASQKMATPNINFLHDLQTSCDFTDKIIKKLTAKPSLFSVVRKMI